MNLIVAVDENWGIGANGKLLTAIPEDMKFFRETTMGKTVIVGRKTVATFPNGKPLKNRRNIILTRDADFKMEGAEIAHSVEEALALCKDEDSENVFVIGGESVYREMLDACDTAYVTFIEYSYSADAFMPNLDEDPAWELAEESDEKTCFDLIYYFRVYKRKK